MKRDHVSDAARLQLFIDAVTDYAIFTLDAQGYVTSWNSGAQRIKGYAAHEILGQHFSRFYTEADRANGKPQRALQIAREQGRYEEDGWRVRKDGTFFWASVVIDPIYEDGELVGFAKITRDVSARRVAQDALAESERRFRLLVQNVVDYAIYMLDLNGLVVNWNAGAERLKGYRADAIVGRHFSTFYTAEDRAAGIPALALSTAEREGKFEAEGWRVRQDGTRFFASVTIDAIRNYCTRHFPVQNVAKAMYRELSNAGHRRTASTSSRA